LSEIQIIDTFKQIRDCIDVGGSDVPLVGSWVNRDTRSACVDRDLR
jgi:hypothetical protein